MGRRKERGCCCRDILYERIINFLKEKRRISRVRTLTESKFSETKSVSREHYYQYSLQGHLKALASFCTAKNRREQEIMGAREDSHIQKSHDNEKPSGLPSQGFLQPREPERTFQRISLIVNFSSKNYPRHPIEELNFQDRTGNTAKQQEYSLKYAA